MGGGQGATYAGMARDFIDALKGMMESVIGAELRFGAPILKSLAIMYVGRQFVLLMCGDLTAMTFLRTSVRVLLVAYLVGQSPHYVERIRDPVFDLPQTLQSAVLSGVGAGSPGGDATPARQFDNASAAGDAVTARIQARSTAWSIASLVNAASASAYNGWFQSLLSWTFALYMVGQALLAVVLCFGPLMLLFELFERTRGWVDQWLGKIVGIVSYGLGTAILLALQMTHLHRMLADIDANLPAGGAEAVARFAKVVSFAGVDLILMIVLPAATAYGSGTVAGAIAPAVMTVASRGASFVGAAANRALARAAGRSARHRANAVTRA